MVYKDILEALSRKGNQNMSTLTVEEYTAMLHNTIADCLDNVSGKWAFSKQLVKAGEKVTTENDSICVGFYNRSILYPSAQDGYQNGLAFVLQSLGEAVTTGATGSPTNLLTVQLGASTMYIVPSTLYDAMFESFSDTKFYNQSAQDLYFVFAFKVKE